MNGYCHCGCGQKTSIPKRNRKELGHKKGIPLKFLRGHWMKTHGLSKHPLYACWADMKDRCKNPNNQRYKRYGDRGIKICNEWDNNFFSFYIFAIKNGWKIGLTIDRRDNDGHYEPSNCRFVTQQINRRNSKNSKIWIAKGIRYPTHREAAKSLGIARSTYISWCSEFKNGCYSYPKYSNENQPQHGPQWGKGA